MSVSQFNLPDVGEGLTEAEIVSWKVKPGDAVKVNDIIVEIETAKSAVELPSPYAGVVDSLLVEEGQTVPVGTPIIAVNTGTETPVSDVATPGADLGAESSGSDAAAPTGTGADEKGATDTGADTPAAEDERQPVLVGYGPRSSSPGRRQRKRPAAASEPPPDQQRAQQSAHAGSAQAPASGDGRARVLAKPPVRKLAKDLGIDISTVTPTGPNGTVTREDVQAAAAPVADTADEAVREPAGVSSELGWNGQPRTERIPVRSVRRKTAQAMVESAFTAPHVTEFITVDVSRSVKLAERLREKREFRDVKLTPLALLARAMCLAIPRTPEVNARWDEDAGEIVMQRYVNLGIAAATPRGLVVPNIKEAHQLSLRDLAVAINDLASTAREGKTPPADMQGGTISITNVGVFGVDTGTPIINPGEAAILAFGAIREQPWVHKGKIKPRSITTLALSFDHRLVDGEQGSRFLSDVASLLEDPANALAWSMT
ncbi:2-oxo acid dehydrogenase subunit E2 [Actinobacteria bacterium YIM 96077]|uniref:Dihydrolipoamide acetyltransferase component of pyruvate dehydrogenase complex n=1 Tax=Phytoactinopolyspora halophila TaxID=1981511 RepID=A0A329R135_9ACTN|nr:dihydrolipoamide acetyltransferase family protein [Phytoactinopolyspora halophila]AYY11661.1 2-oxo acid dehydrogenase subunit E2 [Actinobacteria bacterium YIM 96077]RAW17906.1 2-oxo acid dehydrogenase subunit E2 [Phytoactinopolyspora halophila]